MFGEFCCRWGVKFKFIGLCFGFIGIVCLNLFFLLVVCGFVFFCVIDILFEYVIKYYVWLGYFMMIVFILYGLFYMIVWYVEGYFIERVSIILIILI